MAEQSGGEHARIIQHQEISRRQQRWQVAYAHVAHRAARPLEGEQARLAARRSRLRDQFGRQVEIEIADLHDMAGLTHSTSSGAE